jgi:hypothetical protein
MTGVQPALAAGTLNSGYTIEGTVPDAGTTFFPDPSGAAKELDVINESTAKLGNIGTDAPPTLAYNAENPGNDLSGVWMDTNVVNGQVWLYFAFSRLAASTGQVVFEFDKNAAPVACNYAGAVLTEPPGADTATQTLINTCNPWANRSVGDFSLAFDAQGQGLRIVKRTFNGTGWDVSVLDATVSAATNGPNSLSGEGVVNLSATVFPQNPTSCLSIANILPYTITGNSDSADMKDVILADFTSAIAISNCGTVKVVKSTDPAGQSGTFPYTLSRADSSAVRYDGSTSIPGTLTADGDYDLLNDLKIGTNYALSESLSDPAWALQSISCSMDGSTFDVVPGGQNFSVQASTLTTCTITNKLQQGTIIIKKVTDPAGSTQSFEFNPSWSDESFFLIDGQEQSFTLGYGIYSVEELVPTGWDLKSATCSDSSAPSVIDLAPGETVTCTFINDPLPTVDLVKDVTPSTLAEPGGAFNYTLTIYNTSVEPVTITALTDNNPLPAECTVLINQIIPAGGSVSCTYSVTHTEPGSYPNTASVTVQDDDGKTASDTDNETVAVTDVIPTVDLVKDVTPATRVEPGGAFDYTLTIYNTSLEPVTLTALTDTNALPTSCTDLIGQTIPVGGSVSCAYSVTHTEPGSYPNTASVTVEDNEGNPASDEDTETVTVTDVMPTVDLTKDVTPATLPEPGGVFTFTLTIKNTSIENVTIAALTDDYPLPSTCTDLIGDALTPGQSVSCTYDVTHTEKGSYDNTASVTVEDNEGNPASDSDSETVTVTDEMPTVDLTKDVTPATRAEPGGVFSYTLTIQNTSIEAVTVTSLTDTNPLPLGCTDLIGDVLSPGQSVFCTYDVTQTEASSYPNTASVTVEDNDGNTASDTDSETVTVTDVMPTVDLVKDVTPSSLPEPGGVFTFTLTIHNTTIEPVQVTALTDDNPLPAECTGLIDKWIPAGGALTCSYAVTHTNAGTYNNTASVIVRDNEGNTADDTDSKTVTVTDVKPDITITKTASPTSVPETGGDVTFSFLVENKGIEPVTLTSLTDTQFGDLNGKGTCATGGVIPVGGSYTCEYTVFLASDSLTDHNNVVTAVGTDNDGSTDTATDDETVTFTDVKPDISITKTASPTRVPETGGDVTFTFLVENIGVEDVTLTSLVDSKFGDLGNQGDCAIGGLISVGSSYSCSITVKLAADDLAAHYNVVTAIGTDDDGSTDTATDDETVTFDDVAPDISITKTASPTHVPETGGNVTFTFLVENNGVEDVTLTSLNDTVFDDLNGQGDCVTGGLIPVGGSYSCSITKFLEADDLAAHYNVVTAVATDDDGSQDTATDDETVIFDDVAPMVRITKTASPSSVPETGANVKFTFLVENTGMEDVTLTSLNDTVFGDLDGKGTCDVPQTILIGGSYSCEYTVFLASDSLTAHTNVVTATAVDDDGTPASDDDDETVAFEDIAPLIEVTKTANPTHVLETGDNVTFTIEVKNMGVEDVTLSSLIDDRFGDLNGQGTCAIGDLIPVGGSYTCQVTKFLASDSLTPHTNVVTAVAVDDDGTSATDYDDETVTFDNLAPVIHITKTADPTHVPETGGDVIFTFLVENTGMEDVTLTSLTDTVFGDLGGQGTCVLPQTVLVGGSYSCTYTVFLASDSLTAHYNVSTATAVDDDNTPASDDDDETVTFNDVAPVIRITKTANPTHVSETGGDVTFTFLVENIGAEDVTLTTLSDTKLGDLDGKGTCDVPQTILIGGFYSCEYTVFLASDSLTDHYNVVTATAVDDDGTPASDDDDETVAFDDVAPAILVTKTADPISVPETGADVTFTITVKNVGTEPVTLIGAVDTVFGLIDVSLFDKTYLPVGETATYSFVEFMAGEPAMPHENVVTVTAEDNEGTDATGSDDADVDYTNVAPTIMVEKTPSVASVPETGGDVTFTFVVKNTSTEEPVTITSLVDSVYGTLPGDDDCKVGTVLAAGLSCEFTLTQWVEGDYSGPDHYNKFTAKAVDNDNTEAMDDDDATVDFTDVAPTIMVEKTPNVTSVPETGGDVTFTFKVTNTSTEEAVTITSLVDSVYGKLAGDADCAVGTVLAAGAECTFSITEWVEGDFSGPDHVNVFTGKAVDNDNTEATDSDDATVDFTNVIPTIEVTKTPGVASVPETGGDVTFTFVVKNTSTKEPITITSLSDSVEGTLAGDDDCKLGTVLAAGASCEFSLAKWVEGDFSGPDHANVFTAKAVDNDKTEATDTDDATVDFTNVAPSIDVTKTANPTYVLIPGGNVTFTFVVKNTSTEEAVTITSLSDSVYGTLVGDADCAVDTILAAGASCEFSVIKFVGGTIAVQHINVFTAKAVDNDNTEATDTDDATVELLATTSKIAPTQTTCQQYRDGTAMDYTELFYNVSKGKIGSVAPGVIFFWSTIVAPSADFSLEGHQLNSSGTLKWRDMANLDVFLWDANCDKVQTVTLTKAVDGHPLLNVTGATPDATYYFSVKYDTSSIAGTAVKNPYPTVNYTFQTWLNGTFVITSPDSVAVKPKK